MGGGGVAVKVTYDGNGYTGGAVPTDSTVYGAGDYATVKAPGTMVKDGATFAGWKSLANTKTYYPRNKLMVHRPTTLEALWEPACAINYDTLNALNIEGIPPFDGRRYNIGDKVTIPPHDDLTALQAIVGEGDGMRMEGYVSLQGWRIITGAEAGREVLRAGDTFTVTGGMVVLQAIWAANEISIAYEINGAEGDTPAIQTALSGRPTTLAEPTCTKVGYCFGGWRDMGSDEVYDAGKEARFLGCTTLEAIWVPLDEYTVHYDANGATGGEPPADDRVYHGDHVYLPAISEQGGIYKTGYTFAGWVLREPQFLLLKPAESFVVAQNTTFYARWMPIDASSRRHVTYTSDETDIVFDGDLPTDLTDYVDGDYAVAKTWAPLKKGRIAIGWKLGDTVYEFGDLVPILGNITLGAIWKTIPPVTLKFSGGTGATGTVADIVCDYTGSIILPAANGFTRTGYFADGWIAPDGQKIESCALIHVNLNGEPEVLEYTVNWVNTTPEHTVTYFSIGHDSGHVPVDPCKYHAGDAIPLAPAGDLRKDGFELAGWDDVTTGRSYSIPTNEEIMAYCSDTNRPDYDSVFPMMWCTRDHTMRAHWVPVAQLFFGSLGASSGLPPESIRVRYKDSISIPGKGTLAKSGYTFVGWKDAASGIIYKEGDVYECTASVTLALQPVFVTANIVEYIIPQDLVIANATWMPKNGYCVNCHSKTVIVPPEMKGNYCWVRSDTGERITETCEIHDIYGDICLTLTPINMSNDGDDRWVWSTQAIAEGLTPMHATGHRCGDYFEFPKNFGAGFSGWILNNDERRIYQPGEKVQIFGHAILRAVYPNATHAVTFLFPTGTLAEAPADTEALTEGTLYQLPSGDGIRGPNGTKLLYWCGLDQTEEQDRDIVRRWYPGEYLRIPTSTETVDGKMLNTAGKLVVYPQFGDKFGASFADNTGKIMTRTGFISDAVYAEMQVIRTPQVTELDRSAHTDDEWKAAWRIPYRAGSANAYTYTGMFGDDVDTTADEEGNAFITSLIAYSIFGWVFYKAAKRAGYDIEDRVVSWLKTMNSPLVTTLEYVYDTATTTVSPPLEAKSGFWFRETVLPDPNKHLHQPFKRAVGWQYVGGESTFWLANRYKRLFGHQYQLRMEKHAGDPIIFGAYGTCRWEATWMSAIIAHYNLAGSMDVFESEIPGTRANYERAANPQWIPHDEAPKYADSVACYPGEFIDRPVLNTDFKITNPFSGVLDNLYRQFMLESTPTACDRWCPKVMTDDGYVYNRAQLLNDAVPAAPLDFWLDAVGYNNLPRDTIGLTYAMPDPESPQFAKYFKKLPPDEARGETAGVYLIDFDLRWSRPEWVEYTYFRELRPDEQKKGNVKFTGEPVFRKDFFAPGEYPRVMRRDDLPNFSPVVVEDGVEYYFDHWEIRKDSDMYRYYTEHDEPDRDKEFKANDRLPRVQLGQPTMLLYLDAIYKEHQPEPEEDEENLELADEDNSSWFVRLFQRGKEKAKRETQLKRINAFSTYQQNAANARHKTQSGGILDKILTGLEIAAAAAIAIGSAVAIATQLKSNKPEIELNEEREVEERLIEVGENDLDVVAEWNKQEALKNLEIQHTEFSFFSSAPEKEEEARKNPEAFKTQEIDILQYEAPPKAPAFKPHLGQGDQFDVVIGEKAKQQKLDLQIKKIEDGNLADAETDYEDAVAPPTTKYVKNDANYFQFGHEISQTWGLKNIEVEKIEYVGDESLQEATEIEIAEGFTGCALVGNPSPHQLTENTAAYPRIVYTPRDPDDPNWYTVGDTVPKVDGKVPVLVRYLTFANTYDDNAPDSETHTVDETYYEPHETVTVEECAAEAPEDMEFAGWILDEDTTTSSVVQPGDTLTQGLCNHKFKALWLPADPTRFPHFQHPAPIVPNPPEEAKLNPVPNFPEPTEEEVD